MLSITHFNQRRCVWRCACMIARLIWPGLDYGYIIIQCYIICKWKNNLISRVVKKTVTRKVSKNRIYPVYQCCHGWSVGTDKIECAKRMLYTIYLYYPIVSLLVTLLIYFAPLILKRPKSKYPPILKRPKSMYPPILKRPKSIFMKIKIFPFLKTTDYVQDLGP